MNDAAVIGFASILVSSVLIYAGMYIAVALALCSFAGVWLIRGDLGIATYLLGQAATDSVASYDIAVVPLFVLMGLLLDVSDVGTDTFRAANQLFRHQKGGLGIATVVANAIFSAVTGVTIAAVAVFTKVAVPEMLRLGYTPRFATGVVAGSGVLGMLIPPSLLMVIFGTLTEASIGDLFIAGIVPGLLITAAFSAAIVFMAYRMPGLIGTPRPLGDADLMGTRELLLRLAPIAGLVVLILGGIYAGLFTATEAAAVGALGALLYAAARGRVNARAMWKLAVATGHVTAAICFLIVAASMYSRMLALSGVPGLLGEWLGGLDLGFTVTVLVYVGLLLLLGTFLDSLSTILLLVPLALPIFVAHGADLVWFGIITILATEAGIITPPMGISVFVVKATLDDQSISVGDIYAGSMPFLVITLLVLALLIAFPILVTGVL